ncbi:putative magnesium transporter MRS2-D [Oryza glaberrima]|uniref:Magnesium transporter n=1 Tax=Oryza glaberrima TaxID=4538 RepID=I1PLC8_ORYGL|nr:putative magnesium transporter MRS2-D [Oryza glaberrima]
MAARRRHVAAGAGAPAPAAGEWAAVTAGGGAAWALSPVEEVGTKQELMRRTGLPPRDLRALDPALSSAASASSCRPSAITGRDRAVVVNLDRARAVITASEVLVPSPRDPAVAPLVRELRARLALVASPTPAPSPSPPQHGMAVGMDGSISPSPASRGGEEAAGNGKDGEALGGGDKALPFEFRALEVCLEFACKSLEHETCTLEKEAHPALDELTSKVSTLNLERVRQIKSRLVAISGKVQKVRDELEHLLDDDMDMAALHLTEKLAYQSSRFDIDKEASELEDHSSRDEEGVEGGGGGDGDDETIAGGGSFSPNTDELEILLESYFVQIDGTLNNLSTLREYVEDTEDYINMMLDEKQNQLLQMGILLSTGTLVSSCAIAVTGVFGINVHISLYDSPASSAAFPCAAAGIVAGSLALYLAALLCYKRAGILQ